MKSKLIIKEPMKKIIIFITLCFLISCETSKDKKPVVAIVGHDLSHGLITEKEFLYSYEFTPTPYSNLKGLEAKKKHLEFMIDKKLMVLEGLSRGLDKDEKVQIQLQWYKDKAVRQQLYREVVRNKVTVSESELRKAFTLYNTKVRVRHLPAPTLEAAQELRKRLLAGASFNELAKVIFKDSTLANNGGDLGYIRWGEMDEDFEKAALSLKVGEISKPVKSKWAYHIIKVEDKIQNAIMTESQFNQKRKVLEKIIKRRKEAKLADQYIKNFMKDKHVRVYGPSVVLLANKSKEILNSNNSLLPLKPPTILDHEISQLGNELKEHLGDVMVEFEGGTWTIGDFLDKLKRIHPDARPAMTSKTNIKDVVARMVRDEFLAREGYRRGLEHSDYVKEEVRKWQEELVFQKFRHDLLDTVSVSVEEMKDYYENHKFKYMVPERVNIREIFVRTKEEAEALLRRIKHGEDFARLARKYSLRKWAAIKGGEFGYFGRGMFGEIGKKALSMNVGEIAGPLKLNDAKFGEGYSIFEVIAKKERRPKTFGEAQEQVLVDLILEKQDKLLKKFLQKLRNKYAIKVYENRLAKIKTTDEIARGRKIQMYVVPRF